MVKMLGVCFGRIYFRSGNLRFVLQEAFECYGDLAKIPSINHLRLLADLGEFLETIQKMILPRFEATKLEGTQLNIIA